MRSSSGPRRERQRAQHCATSKSRSREFTPKQSTNLRTARGRHAETKRKLTNSTGSWIGTPSGALRIWPQA
eukprot:1266007-Prymnesium_polylepis.1